MCHVMLNSFYSILFRKILVFIQYLGTFIRMLQNLFLSYPIYYVYTAIQMLFIEEYCFKLSILAEIRIKCVIFIEKIAKIV